MRARAKINSTPKRSPIKGVNMTDDQMMRQNMQVRWLELAIEAQNARGRELPTLSVASLYIESPCVA